MVELFSWVCNRKTHEHLLLRYDYDDYDDHYARMCVQR